AVHSVLEVLAEEETHISADHVDGGLAVAVVVGAGAEARRRLHVARPQRAGAGRLLGDAGLARHAGRLGGRAIALGRTNDLDPCHRCPPKNGGPAHWRAGGPSHSIAGAAPPRPTRPPPTRPR